jgi:hypothetical protein
VEKKLEWDGHGNWTGRSRKPDGMVKEAGRDGHGSGMVSGQKRKIYCNRYRVGLSKKKHGDFKSEVRIHLSFKVTKLYASFSNIKRMQLTLQNFYTYNKKIS